MLLQNAAITITGNPHSVAPQEFVAANRPSVVALNELRAVWNTNIFGGLAVYRAMLPILRDTPNARIVNISSGVGSLMLASDRNSPTHRSFDATHAALKTALDGLTIAMANELKSACIKVNAVSPRYTKRK